MADLAVLLFALLVAVTVTLLPDTDTVHHDVCDEVAVMPEDMVPALEDVTVTADEPPAAAMDTLVGLNV